MKQDSLEEQALSLQIGHRKSIYLDFYAQKFPSASTFIISKSITFLKMRKMTQCRKY